MAELEQVGKEAPPWKEGEWVGCQGSSDTSAGSSSEEEEETGQWQDALDYKGDNDQEPDVCPHDCATKGMGGLCRTGRTASGKPHGQQEKSTQPAHKESTSTGPWREDSSPSKLHMEKLTHPAHQEPTSAGPCLEDSPPTQIPTKPEQPSPWTSQEATAKQPVTAALDCPQQLAEASGQAFSKQPEAQLGTSPHREACRAALTPNSAWTISAMGAIKSWMADSVTTWSERPGVRFPHSPLDWCSGNLGSLMSGISLPWLKVARARGLGFQKKGQ